jgi:hypothetical protein
MQRLSLATGAATSHVYVSVLHQSRTAQELTVPSVPVQTRFLQVVVRTLCVLGVGMIMGDGVLTPAISVVSAIEGLGQIPGGAGNIDRSESRDLALSRMPYSLGIGGCPVAYLGCRLVCYCFCGAESASRPSRAALLISSPDSALMLAVSRA